MSTKLYSGIKFKSKRLGEVIRQLNSLKEESVKNVMDTFRDTDSLNFIHMCILYEECVKEGMQEDKYCYFHFERKLRKRLNEPYNEFCFEFCVMIYERKGTLYGIYFDHSHVNSDMLFERGIAVDYHYQDQTDPPEDVPARQWKFRKKVWEDIFDDISPLWVPSEAGVRYDIVTCDDISVTNEMLSDIRKKCEEIKSRKPDKRSVEEILDDMNV